MKIRNFLYNWKYLVSHVSERNPWKTANKRCVHMYIWQRFIWLRILVYLCSFTAFKSFFTGIYQSTYVNDNRNIENRLFHIIIRLLAISFIFKFELLQFIFHCFSADFSYTSTSIYSVINKKNGLCRWQINRVLELPSSSHFIHQHNHLHIIISNDNDNTPYLTCIQIHGVVQALIIHCVQNSHAMLVIVVHRWLNCSVWTREVFFISNISIEFK